MEADNRGHALKGVFEACLAPFPFQRLKVTAKDSFGNALVIEGYDKVVINSPSDFSGRHIFTIYIQRDVDGNIDDIATKVIEL